MNVAEKKYKILLLSDHMLSTSGVGTQSRWLTFGLTNTGKYSFRQLGGAVKHGNYNVVKVNDDIIIKPVDGFGGRELLKQILVSEKPDALMLFTDPRFFVWAWEMEDEIHQICPIVYWHLWDNAPAPVFNNVLYESTDALNCINWPTYNFCKKRWPEKTKFVPHALPDIYRPHSELEQLQYRRELLGPERTDHFICLWVNRNARRKQPGDVIASWKLFLEELEKKHGHKKATLLLHTDPRDQEGANLYVVADMFGVKENVFFSPGRFDFDQMVKLYNACDFVLNRSSAEGFGLSTLEAMQCGKPIIALKTGGMTRQVINHETGEEYGVPLPVEVRALAGSQLVPAIYDDYVSNETTAAAIMKLYEMGPEKRKEIGTRAREYALTEFGMNKMVAAWDETLEQTIQKWRSDRSSIYKPWEMITL